MHLALLNRADARIRTDPVIGMRQHLLRIAGSVDPYSGEATIRVAVGVVVDAAVVADTPVSAAGVQSLQPVVGASHAIAC